MNKDVKKLFLDRYPKLEDYDDFINLMCTDPRTSFPYPIIQIKESDIEGMVHLFIMKPFDMRTPAPYLEMWGLDKNEAYNAHQCEIEIEGAMDILDVAYPNLVQIANAYNAGNIDRESEKHLLEGIGFKSESVFTDSYVLDSPDLFIRCVLGTVNDNALKQYWIALYKKINNKASNASRTLLIGLSLDEVLKKLEGE